MAKILPTVRKLMHEPPAEEIRKSKEKEGQAGVSKPSLPATVDHAEMAHSFRSYGLFRST
jgi:hypothetical protein